MRIVPDSLKQTFCAITSKLTSGLQGIFSGYRVKQEKQPEPHPLDEAKLQFPIAVNHPATQGLSSSVPSALSSLKSISDNLDQIQSALDTEKPKSASLSWLQEQKAIIKKQHQQVIGELKQIEQEVAIQCGNQHPTAAELRLAIGCLERVSTLSAMRVPLLQTQEALTKISLLPP